MCLERRQWRRPALIHRTSAGVIRHETTARLLHNLSSLRIPRASDACSPTPGGSQRYKLRVSIVSMQSRMGLHSGVDLPRLPDAFTPGHHHRAAGRNSPCRSTGQHDTAPTASADIPATRAGAGSNLIDRCGATATRARSTRVELGTAPRTSAGRTRGPQCVRLVRRAAGTG